MNLRRGLPMVFGCDISRAKFEAEVRAAQEKQTAEFCVAPRCQVRTDSGDVLDAGQEVTRAMISSQELQKHLSCSRVIERLNEPGPEAA